MGDHAPRLGRSVGRWQDRPSGAGECRLTIIVTTALLAGCSQSNSEKIAEAVASIDDGMKRADSSAMAEGKKLLNEVIMDRIGDKQSNGIDPCNLMEGEALHTLYNVSDKMADFLETKSEAAARNVVTGNDWNFVRTDKFGTCGVKETEALSKHALQFVQEAKAAVLKVHPNLEKKIAAEQQAEQQKRIAEEGTTETRWAECRPNTSEMQNAFDQFVRLEDRNGKDNDAHEAILADVFGTTPSCIHRTMIRALESGVQPSI